MNTDGCIRPNSDKFPKYMLTVGGTCMCWLIYQQLMKNVCYIFICDSTFSAFKFFILI